MWRCASNPAMRRICGISGSASASSIKTAPSVPQLLSLRQRNPLSVQVDGAVLAELREVDDSGRAGRHCDCGQVGGDLDGAIGYVRRDIGYRQRGTRSIGGAPIERTRLVWQVQHEMDVARRHVTERMAGVGCATIHRSI